MWACIAFAVIFILAAIFGGRLPGRYRHRTCQGRSWRRAFPDAPKGEIREFLSLFTDGFAFRQSERLKLSPDDRVLDIYRELYPWRGEPDALELETFAEYLDERYGLDLERVWHDDLSLGAVFSLTRRSMATRSPPADSSVTRLQKSADHRGSAAWNA